MRAGETWESLDEGNTRVPLAGNSGVDRDRKAIYNSPHVDQPLPVPARIRVRARGRVDILCIYCLLGLNILCDCVTRLIVSRGRLEDL